jgi:hypothetical protein
MALDIKLLVIPWQSLVCVGLGKEYKKSRGKFNPYLFIYG